MSELEPPTFDDWVEYCFTRGYADFGTRGEDRDFAAVVARCERFIELAPDVLAEYVVELFRSPALVAERYRDDQIADGTSFLFGIASGYFHTLRSPSLSADVQAECIASVETLYTVLYDQVCCKHDTDVNERYTDTLRVDGAVFMIWDMDCIEGALMFPKKKQQHLVEAGFDVLAGVLARCRTSTCLASALHGLAHLHSRHRERVEALIDDFAGSRRVPPWLRDYAREARTGHVLQGPGAAGSSLPQIAHHATTTTSRGGQIAPCDNRRATSRVTCWASQFGWSA